MHQNLRASQRRGCASGSAALVGLVALAAALAAGCDKAKEELLATRRPSSCPARRARRRGSAPWAPAHAGQLDRSRRRCRGAGAGRGERQHHAGQQRPGHRRHVEHRSGLHNDHDHDNHDDGLRARANARARSGADAESRRGRACQPARSHRASASAHSKPAGPGPQSAPTRQRDLVETINAACCSAGNQRTGVVARVAEWDAYPDPAWSQPRAGDQRGAALGHRGARDEQGGTAVNQRGAHDGQPGAQDARSTRRRRRQRRPEELHRVTEIGVLFVDRSRCASSAGRRARPSTFNVLGGRHRPAAPRPDEPAGATPSIASATSTACRRRCSAARARGAKQDRRPLVPVCAISPYRTMEDLIAGAVHHFDRNHERRAGGGAACAASEAWMRFGRRRRATTRSIYASTAERPGEELEHAAPSGCSATPPTRSMGRAIDRLFPPGGLGAAGCRTDELRRARRGGRAADERWHMRKDGTRFYCSGIDDADPDPHLLRLREDRPRPDRAAADRSKADRDELLQAGKEGRAQKSRRPHRRWTSSWRCMSHELKQPAQPDPDEAPQLIGLRSEVVRGREELARAADTIYQHRVRTQARLIDDLLDLSRVMTGKLALNRTGAAAAASSAARAAPWRRCRAGGASQLEMAVGLRPTADRPRRPACGLSQIAWNLGQQRR